MKKTMLYCTIICLTLILSCHNKNSEQDFVGQIVKVIDGDTYDLLLEDNTTVRVRMDGIDAPEKGMPFSKKAKKYLGDLCQGQIVKIHNNELDQYGRIISFPI